MEILFDDGKYKVIKTNKKTEVLRYNEDWRDITGDKFVASLLHEIQELREKIEILTTQPTYTKAANTIKYHKLDDVGGRYLRSLSKK